MAASVSTSSQPRHLAERAAVGRGRQHDALVLRRDAARSTSIASEACGARRACRPSGPRRWRAGAGCRTRSRRRSRPGRWPAAAGPTRRRPGMPGPAVQRSVARTAAAAIGDVRAHAHRRHLAIVAYPPVPWHERAGPAPRSSRKSPDSRLTCSRATMPRDAAFRLPRRPGASDGCSRAHRRRSASTTTRNGWASPWAPRCTARPPGRELADDIGGGPPRAWSAMVVCLEDSVADADLAGAELNAVDQLRELAAGGPTTAADDLRPGAHGRADPDARRRARRRTPTCSPASSCRSSPRRTARVSSTRSSPPATSIGRRLLVMPVLESAELSLRRDAARAACSARDGCWTSTATHVPAVRVGATDLSAAYGLRRARDFTVWDVRVVADVIAAVVNVFGRVDGQATSSPGRCGSTSRRPSGCSSRSCASHRSSPTRSARCAPS